MHFTEKLKKKSEIYRKTYTHSNMSKFPKIIYEDIIKSNHHESMPNEYYVTSLVGCPRKAILQHMLEKYGYKEVRSEYSTWFPYRGNVWDDHLSRLFDEHGGKSQVSLMTIVPIIEDGEVVDGLVIRARIDAMYWNGDTLEVIDFKTANQDYLDQDKHVKPGYVVQVSYYSKILNTPHYGLFFVTNKHPQYERFEDDAGLLRTEAFDKLVETAVRLYKLEKEGRIPREKKTDYCNFCPFFHKYNTEGKRFCEDLVDVENVDEKFREILKKLEELGKIEKIK